jgi:dTDP-4-amino-4,6-dideoxy-D-glucose/dTDP-4-amino-2,4-dideoxy-beta-L-xylose transaminase
MIPLFKVAMSEKAGSAVANVLNSGYIGQGEKVEQFESDLRSHFNNDFVVTVNSATSGLHLALRLHEDSIRKSYDGPIEVLTTALTCTATNWPILANNMGIKWVDVSKDNFNMDLDDLERKLSPSTRIIMVVHWGGDPVDYNRLKKIRIKCHELYGFYPAFIEDCAHSFGSAFAQSQIGVDILPNSVGVFSFQAIKHLTSVDGGAMVVPSYMYRDAKLLRWYGIDRESNTKDFRCEADIESWGYKFHMNDVNATVGIENLKVINPIVQAHKDNARYYNDHLCDIGGIFIPNSHPWSDSAYWIYTMCVDNQDGFMRHMASRGISVSRVHERNDKHTAVKQFQSALPNLDKTVKEMICIPVGWWVSEENRSYIVDAIKEGW